MHQKQSGKGQFELQFERSCLLRLGDGMGKFKQAIWRAHDCQKPANGNQSCGSKKGSALAQRGQCLRIKNTGIAFYEIEHPSAPIVGHQGGD